MKNLNFRILIILFLFTFNLQAQDYSYDEQIGAESAKQVEQTIGIYQDSVLTSYVQAVGQRLVDALGETPFTFQFHVVDMAEPNAFALPGGYIYISRGLLSLVNDEAELACVIGHEMIHVTKRHSVKQMKKSIFPSILHIPGAVVGMFNSNLGNIINAPISLGSELFLNNYSRKQETESDKLGINLASMAGYNPEKLAIMLERLSKDAEQLTGEAEKKSYFSSHPYTPKRVENIDKEIAKLQWTEKPAIAPDTKSLYEKIAGMVYGPNPAQGVFDSTVFKHPDLNLSITFPNGWNTINVPVAVGAMQKDGEARLVYMINDSVVEPDTIGKAFAKYLENEYKLKPDQNQSLDINGFPAYVVSLTDATGQQPVKVQVYWIKTEGLLFNVVGMSFMKHSEAIANAVKSTRPLTDAEKKNIKGIYLQVATAEKDETIETLSQRTNNNWDTEITSFKNGLESTAVLQVGQALKIAVEKSYISR